MAIVNGWTDIDLSSAAAMLRAYRRDCATPEDPLVAAEEFAEKLEAERDEDSAGAELDRLEVDIEDLHIELERAGLEGPLNIESVQARVTALVGQRDEVREVLRELVAHLDVVGPFDSGPINAPSTRAIRDRARTVLEGAERTHTLVPNAILERLSVAVVSTAEPEAGDEVMSQALDAAARGEHVGEWPS